MAGGTASSLSLGSSDAWLLKLDQNGDVQWQKSYGRREPGWQQISSTWFSQVRLTADGGYIAAGTTSAFGAGGYDAFVVQPDSLGDLTAECTIVGQTHAVTVPHVVEDAWPYDSPLQQAEAPFVAQSGDTAWTDIGVTTGGVCVNGRMPVPADVIWYWYAPVLSPSLSEDPSEARPIAVGNAGYNDMPFVFYQDSLTLQVGILPFVEPVDLYLAVYCPEISPDIWFIRQDYSLHPASEGVEAWKLNINGTVDEILYGHIPLVLLPSGTYYFALMATPTGRTDRFYVWATSFQYSQYRK
jgi:hypothetical protein